MLQIKVTEIAPDDNTVYLVGPSGETVWTQPALGEPYILAARNPYQPDLLTYRT